LLASLKITAVITAGGITVIQTIGITPIIGGKAILFVT
jgi:hypothetical protein